MDRAIDMETIGAFRAIARMGRPVIAIVGPRLGKRLLQREMIGKGQLRDNSHGSDTAKWPGGRQLAPPIEQAFAKLKTLIRKPRSVPSMASGDASAARSKLSRPENAPT